MNCLNNWKIEFTNISGTDMTDEKYFAIPALSTSKLKLIDPEHDGSIEKFEAGFQGGYSQALVLGSAIHNQILSPDEYLISDYCPECKAKMKFFVECFCKYRKQKMKTADALVAAAEEADYYKGIIDDPVKGKKYITKVIEESSDYYRRLYKGEFDKENNDGKVVMVLEQSVHDKWENAVKNLTADFTYRNLMGSNPFGTPKEIINEMAFFSDIIVTFPNGEKMTLPYKGKADNIIIDHDNKVIYLNDIKTTSKGVGFFMPKVVGDVCYAGTFEKNGYYMQLANYLVMVEYWAKYIKKLPDYSYRSCIFAVETTNNHLAQVFPINNSYIQEGLKDFKKLICLVAHYKKYGTTIEFK